MESTEGGIFLIWSRDGMQIETGERPVHNGIGKSGNLSKHLPKVAFGRLSRQ